MRLSRPVLAMIAAVPAALFVALAVALAFGLRNDPRALPSVLVGHPAPVFNLGPVRAGDVGFTSADIRGHVALINVFGSWCGVCQEENPTLLQLRAQGVRLYGIDWKDAPADGAAWLTRFGDPFIRVGNDESGRLALDLGVTGAPETFVIDRHGRVAYKHVGAVTAEVWRDRLAPLVARLEAEP